MRRQERLPCFTTECPDCATHADGICYKQGRASSELDCEPVEDETTKTNNDESPSELAIDGTVGLTISERKTRLYNVKFRSHDCVAWKKHNARYNCKVKAEDKTQEC
jgi:hypothetical protein